MTEEETTPAADPAPKRGARGRWKPGSSGNPGGKGQLERNILREAREAAGSFAPEALKTLVNIMRNRRVSHAVRLAAASAILDRAVGKPSAPPASNFDDGSEVPRLDLEAFTDLEKARRIAWLLTNGMRALADQSRPPPAVGAISDEEGESE